MITTQKNAPLCREVCGNQEQLIHRQRNRERQRVREKVTNFSLIERGKKNTREIREETKVLVSPKNRSFIFKKFHERDILKLLLCFAITFLNLILYNNEDLNSFPKLIKVHTLSITKFYYFLSIKENQIHNNLF